MNTKIPNGLSLEEYQILKIQKGLKGNINAICEQTKLFVILNLKGEEIISMKCNALKDDKSCRSPRGPVNDEGKIICNINI